MDSVCCIGRTITRPDNFAGLDWETPCPVPAEEELIVDHIPVAMCVAHFDPLHAALAEAGFVEKVAESGALSPADELIERWGSPGLGDGH